VPITSHVKPASNNVLELRFPFPGSSVTILQFTATNAALRPLRRPAIVTPATRFAVFSGHGNTTLLSRARQRTQRDRRT
jgi:hypothetical protein